MAWPESYLVIRAVMNGSYTPVWLSAPDLARYLKCKPGKARYWLERMIDDRWIIWRWHPNRHGWHATRQYALPDRAKERDMHPCKTSL